MKTDQATRNSKELNHQLLNHEFSCDEAFMERCREAKIVARHYSKTENAVAVLSNMPFDTSYICSPLVIHLTEKASASWTA